MAIKVLHLRSSGDMGKRRSNRTFCGMPSSKGGMPCIYRVTEYSALVTCFRCQKKLMDITRADIYEKTSL